MTEQGSLNANHSAGKFSCSCIVYTGRSNEISYWSISWTTLTTRRTTNKVRLYLIPLKAYNTREWYRILGLFGIPDIRVNLVEKVALRNLLNVFSSASLEVLHCFTSANLVNCTCGIWNSVVLVFLFLFLSLHHEARSRDESSYIHAI